MRTISQRELRNDSAEVMRAVEQGESFVVTRRGVPVADLVPHEARRELPVARPARRRIDWSSLPLVECEVSTAEVLDDLRGDR